METAVWRVYQHCWLLVVKYLREVTPYFRKTSSSVLSDVGWTDDSKSSSPSERAIPLRLCYVCRGDRTGGSAGVDAGSDKSSPTVQSVSASTTLELHSPDGRSCCLLRCGDDDTASQWLTAICNVVASLTARAVADVNARLSATSNGAVSPNNNNASPSLGADVKHLGWLAEQVGSILPHLECAFVGLHFSIFGRIVVVHNVQNISKWSAHCFYSWCCVTEVCSFVKVFVVTYTD